MDKQARFMARIPSSTVSPCRRKEKHGKRDGGSVAATARCGSGMELIQPMGAKVCMYVYVLFSPSAMFASIRS